MVEYKYDAWGKPIGDVIGTLAELNPFRYRGYVWDEKTGLYYLRERFYCSTLYRFVSIDRKVNGNIYAYTKNKVICFADYSGMDDESVTICVNTHAKPGSATKGISGIHLSITIDDVVFSYAGKVAVISSNDYAKENEVTRFIISDIPFDIAKQAVGELINNCFGEEAEKVFSQSSSIKGGCISLLGKEAYYSNPEGKIIPYNVTHTPCAWFVETMLDSIGILNELSVVVGSIRRPDDFVTHEKDESNYLRAYEYLMIRVYGYGDHYLRYSDRRLLWGKNE